MELLFFFRIVPSAEAVPIRVCWKFLSLDGFDRFGCWDAKPTCWRSAQWVTPHVPRGSSSQTSSIGSHLHGKPNAAVPHACAARHPQFVSVQTR